MSSGKRHPFLRIHEDTEWGRHDSQPVRLRDSVVRGCLPLPWEAVLELLKLRTEASQLSNFTAFGIPDKGSGLEGNVYNSVYILCFWFSFLRNFLINAKVMSSSARQQKPDNLNLILWSLEPMYGKEQTNSTKLSFDIHIYSMAGTAPTYAHTHACTHTRMYTHMRTHMCTHMCTHTCAHTRTSTNNELKVKKYI